MSQDGQIANRITTPYETADRPMVGYAHDYPAGWHTGMHSHGRVQLLAATEGVMRIETERALFTVPPGTGLWMPADTPHAVRMAGPVRMRALFLRADASRTGPRDTMVIAISALLREVILAACAEPIAWDPRGRGPHLVALALDEIGRAATLPLGLPAVQDARLRRVTETLRANPADPRDAEALAAEAGASARTLARLFRQQTGMTFHQWRRQLRLTEGLARLATGEHPARAAASVGYASAPAFGAAFREVFGTTPGQARASRHSP